MVFEIARCAKRVLIAEDDDQAIHRWTGVDVKRFLGASNNFHVWIKAYAMPSLVHELSQKVVGGSQFEDQDFNPRDNEGRIDWALNPPMI